MFVWEKFARILWVLSITNCTCPNSRRPDKVFRNTVDAASMIRARLILSSSAISKSNRFPVVLPLLDCNSVISKPHYSKSFSTDSPVGPFVGSDDHIVRVVNRKGNAFRQARVHWLLASLVIDGLCISSGDGVVSFENSFRAAILISVANEHNQFLMNRHVHSFINKQRNEWACVYCLLYVFADNIGNALFHFGNDWMMVIRANLLQIGTTIECLKFDKIAEIAVGLRSFCNVINCPHHNSSCTLISLVGHFRLFMHHSLAGFQIWRTDVVFRGRMRLQCLVRMHAGFALHHHSLFRTNFGFQPRIFFQPLFTKWFTGSRCHWLLDMRVSSVGNWCLFPFPIFAGRTNTGTFRCGCCSFRIIVLAGTRRRGLEYIEKSSLFGHLSRVREFACTCSRYW